MKLCELTTISSLPTKPWAWMTQLTDLAHLSSKTTSRYRRASSSRGCSSTMTSTWNALQTRQSRKMWMLGLCCVIVPSLSGQLIKKLDTFPEQKQTYSMHDRPDKDGVRYSIATTTIAELWSIGRTDKQLYSESEELVSQTWTFETRFWNMFLERTRLRQCTPPPPAFMFVSVQNKLRQRLVRASRPPK